MQMECVGWIGNQISKICWQTRTSWYWKKENGNVIVPLNYMKVYTTRHLDTIHLYRAQTAEGINLVNINDHQQEVEVFHVLGNTD